MFGGGILAATLQRLVLVVCIAFAFNAWGSDTAIAVCIYGFDADMKITFATSDYLEPDFKGTFRIKKGKKLSAKTWKKFSLNANTSKKVCPERYWITNHIIELDVSELPKGGKLGRIECSGTGSMAEYTYNLNEGYVKIQSTPVELYCTFTWSNTISGTVKLALSVAPEAYLRVGNELTYVYEVTNNGWYDPDPVGNVRNVVITGIRGDTCTIGNLPGGKTKQCTITYSVTQDDIEQGSITNRAQAKGNYPDGSPFITNVASATATYIPAATGSVHFVNNIEGGPSGQKFTYTLIDAGGNDVSLNPSELGDGEKTTAEGVPTGSAILTVTPTEGYDGWTLSVSDGSCTVEEDGTVTVPVEEGQETDCTFTNTLANGSLKIVLGLEDGSLGANQRFGFGEGNLGSFALPSGGNYEKTFDDLTSGEYTISQVSQPNKAWSLGSISCDAQDYSIDDNAVTVNLTGGEDATCTFTARFDAVDDAMAQESLRFIYRRVDTLLCHGPVRSRLMGRV
ncbi:MAG: hypothetical protein GY877_03195, partial [Hyphomicrobium sp.]|nr:hypothetical protein [Hyphomicrobium sp.]